MEDAIPSTEVTEADMLAAAGKYPIEMLSEATLADSSVEQCELLLTYLRGINRVLIAKADIVHSVMEAKARAEINDRKLAGATDDEIASLEDAIARRKAKPPAQNLGGSHITKDNDQVNPGS